MTIVYILLAIIVWSGLYVLVSLQKTARKARRRLALVVIAYAAHQWWQSRKTPPPVVAAPTMPTRVGTEVQP